ncbi:MAG: iron-containing alcohol dehydrogenase [Oscillospiraceae bacterium]|nr:iron-containing alcohol dehydrogenase [Oscillospiraceae bacterium]
MNIIIKAACRTFQTVLRLAIPILPYRSPKVLSRVEDIPGVLKEQKIHRVMIVTDGFLHLSGMLEPLKKALSEAGIGYTVYDETVPNPTVWNVEIARERYLAENCQGLIGFGGGSAIDCAKAVGARIARPRKSIPQMRGILKVMRRIPFLIAVPTTAGTGSETTLATVITDDKADHKFPVNDFPLIPRVAVLDPEMTRNLPAHLTATTGMDALTHAIEAYIGRSTTKDTRADALEAAELISKNLENAYRDGNNMEARANMLRAAFLAGRAFSKSYVGYCHAVAHSLGGKYHIPHGLANAVLLPYVLEAYGETAYKKEKDIAVAMGIADSSTPEETAAEALIACIRKMNADMGIPTKLPGIRTEDIPQLAAFAHREANPLYPVPLLMDAGELERFYYDVMEEAK